MSKVNQIKRKADKKYRDKRYKLAQHQELKFHNSMFKRNKEGYHMILVNSKRGQTSKIVEDQQETSILSPVN